jgi:predicted PurR-regulated permease PerM
VTWVQETLPFPLKREHPVVQRFGQVVKGSIYGNTLVALMEGVIGGIGFWIVGLPSPVLWGTLMGILAYLPVVGASVVWAPAALYLYTQAAYGKVVILCATGVLIMILDYFVRPICVGRVSKIHALLVLFSVLGGLKLFGLLGVVVGPLIVAVGVTLLETYRLERAVPEPIQPTS